MNGWFSPHSLSPKDLLVAAKPNDSVRNNTTDFADDPDLFVTVEPDTAYRLELYLDVQVPVGQPAGFKWQLAGPSGMTFRTYDPVDAFGFSTTGRSIPSSGNIRRVDYGQVLTDAGGTLKFQWAQASAMEVDTTFKAGSYMVLTKVGPLA